MWEKLITSLLPEDNLSVFLSSIPRTPLRNRSPLNSLGPSTSPRGMPVITFPQTEKHSVSPIENSGTVLAVTSAEMSENENKDSTASLDVKDSLASTEVKEAVASSSKTSPTSKKIHSFMSFLKRKGTSSSSSSVSSGATSGFYSQSFSYTKSFENSDDNGDTSL